MTAAIEFPATVLTAHGTALYVDDQAQLLRHGPLATIPNNLAFVVDGAAVGMTYQAGDGTRPIICRSDGQLAVGDHGGATISFADAARWEIVAIGKQEFGLKRNGLFLSAVGGSTAVQLAKRDCRLWEIFRIEQGPGSSSLSAYGADLAYLQNMEKVEGWLDTTAAAVIHRLLRYQANAKIGGNVLEIGVHHGRLFLLLALATKRGERAIAVDIFEDQHLNVSLSGSGDRTILEKNIEHYAPDSEIEVVKANSKDLGEEFIKSHSGARFISIDGDHTREATFSDLVLAERLVTAGGIVALDDIYRPFWSGVTAGLHKYYVNGGKLIPFAMVPNKVLFTLGYHYSRDFRSVLAQEFAHELSKNSEQRQRQQFFDFDDVLYLARDR